MDKILLTAFLSALAGFITAIISIVKLVNEKESKTSEYRQAWTDSLRKSFAELIGLLNAQVANLNSARKTRQELIEFLSSKPKDGEEEITRRATDHSQEHLKDRQTKSNDMHREIYKVYALTRLHFKPDDLSFSRVEQHFNLIMSYLDELEEAEDERAASIKEKVHAAADEITAFSRNILKTEWETVKKGERAYQLTKKWSIAGSILMLFILLSIGAHTIISMWKENIRNGDSFASEKKNPKNNFLEQQSESTKLPVQNILDIPPTSIQISNVADCRHDSGAPASTRRITATAAPVTGEIRACAK